MNNSDCFQQIGRIGELLCTAKDTITGTNPGNDNNLLAFSGSTGKLQHTLIGHRLKPTAVEISTKYDLIVSGSFDKTVRIWNLHSGECLHVLLDHTGWVFTVALWDKIVVSGARDFTICMWNIKTGELIRRLEGHPTAVHRVKVDEKFIVSGDGVGTVKIWSTNDGDCLHTIETGHYTMALLLDSDHDRAFVGARARRTFICTLTSGELLASLESGPEGHHAVKQLFLHQNILVSVTTVNLDVWCIESSTLIYSKTLDETPVGGLLENGNVVVATDKTGVQVLDLQTGNVLYSVAVSDCERLKVLNNSIIVAQTKKEDNNDNLCIVRL